MWQEAVKKVAQGIRKRVFEHTIKNNGGYLSQACSSADFLAVLYQHSLRLGPSIAPPIPRPFAGPPSANNPDSFTGAGYHGARHPDWDRFFISPSHYALVIYAALIEVGRMAPEGLDLFNQDGSSVEMIGAEHSPGMEVTAGSLGLCLSQAAGTAYARQKKQETGRVWVFLSDGEFQEGQTWETLQMIQHYQLNNMYLIVDMNGQQCDGEVDSVMTLGDIASKVRAFGSKVVEVDGHDIEEVEAASRLKSTAGAVVILAYTNPCQCMSHLEGRRPRLHYVRFKSDAEKNELEHAIRQQLYN